MTTGGEQQSFRLLTYCACHSSHVHIAYPEDRWIPSQPRELYVDGAQAKGKRGSGGGVGHGTYRDVCVSEDERLATVRPLDEFGVALLDILAIITNNIISLLIDGIPPPQSIVNLRRETRRKELSDGWMQLQRCDTCQEVGGGG